MDLAVLPPATLAVIASRRASRFVVTSICAFSMSPIRVLELAFRPTKLESEMAQPSLEVEFLLADLYGLGGCIFERFAREVEA